MLRVFSDVLWAPKVGNQAGEYEDAFHPQASGEYAGEELRFAIADGATEGLLSGRWASMLCKLYRRRWQNLDSAPLWLDRAYNDWARDKASYIRRRNTGGHPIQWYEEPGLAAGSFSTLLGLALYSPEGEDLGVFQAVALGDSCLFLVRGGEIGLQFPLADSSQFNDRPVLVSSNPARNQGIVDHFQVVGGELRRGDRFYLMTDALACWFMRAVEAGDFPWLALDELAAAGDGSRTEEWLQGLRQDKQLKNDDVTMLRICIK